MAGITLLARSDQLNSQTPSLQAALPARSSALVPELWQAALATRLGAEETVLAAIETDLDANLQFGRGLLCLTNQAIYALTPAGEWTQWALSPDLSPVDWWSW